jgi:hypothetical protein
MLVSRGGAHELPEDAPWAWATEVAVRAKKAAARLMAKLCPSKSNWRVGIDAEADDREVHEGVLPRSDSGKTDRTKWENDLVQTFFSWSVSSSNEFDNGRISHHRGTWTL